MKNSTYIFNIIIIRNCAVYLACSIGNSQCVKLLCESGCNVNIQNKQKNTCLIISIQEGYDDCVSILCENKVDINIQVLFLFLIIILGC